MEKGSAGEVFSLLTVVMVGPTRSLRTMRHLTDSGWVLLDPGACLL